MNRSACTVTDWTHINAGHVSYLVTSLVVLNTIDVVAPPLKPPVSSHMVASLRDA